MNKKVPAKDKNRQSQKLRAVIYSLWQDHGTAINEEEFYVRFMSKLISNFESVAQYLKSIS